MGVTEEVCNICDATSKTRSHPASHLTDLNNLQNVTCWLSEPSIEYPHNVTLTLSLGKKYELTYISVQFCNRLADSMAFYKSVDFGKTWMPFQFYSTECQKIYSRSPNIKIGKHNEQVLYHKFQRKKSDLRYLHYQTLSLVYLLTVNFNYHD